VRLRTTLSYGHRHPKDKIYDDVAMDHVLRSENAGVARELRHQSAGVARELRHQSAGVARELRHHGDAELAPGLVDLAVNVRNAPMPAWLADPISAALRDLTRYPDQAQARAAVARRHARTTREVLLTAGAAEAFVLLARALLPRRLVVVHPQFTEPEAALWAAGHEPDRVVLSERDGFRLDPDRIPADADLVVIGNPTNPTSVLHPVDQLAHLARPGRVLVVDEAFADTVHDPGAGQPPSPSSASLANRGDLPGLVVVRSLTKTWGLAGLRTGYLLAPCELVERLQHAQPLWPVSTPALAAITACCSDAAEVAERSIAADLARERAHLVRGLRALHGVVVAGEPASSFVLVRLRGADAVRVALRRHGYAVRRGDTFPGLGPDWLRISVRDTGTTDAFLAVLASLLAARPA
jgi:histidinol-phosphate aminotransferase